MEGEDADQKSKENEEEPKPEEAAPQEASQEVVSTKEDVAEETPEEAPTTKNESPSKTPPSANRSRSRSITPYHTPEVKSGSVSFKDASSKNVVSEQKTSIHSGGFNASGSPKLSSKKAMSEIDDMGKDQLVDVLKGSNVAVVRAGDNTTVLHSSIQATGGFPCAGGILEKRSPFIHNPPQPEERRSRISCPRCPRDYIINLREDLADFQESHGLPRTRDYSFLSLGLALAQETGRAIYSVFLMFTELFPILAIISLILRFALDKLIEILETTETVPKIKKSVIFALEMLAIMIPLWILIGTIIIPLITLLFSIFKRMFRIKGGKKKVVAKSKGKVKSETCAFN